MDFDFLFVRGDSCPGRLIEMSRFRRNFPVFDILSMELVELSPLSPFLKNQTAFAEAKYLCVPFEFFRIPIQTFVYG